MVTASCQHIDETNLYQAPNVSQDMMLSLLDMKRSVQNMNVVTRQRIVGAQGRILIDRLSEHMMMIT